MKLGEPPMQHVICFVVMALLWTATCQAQEVGDTERGAVLAAGNCARCHAIRKGQLSPNSRAPTFVELATSPGVTIAALTVPPKTRHPGMPTFMLSSEQRQDIITYIFSLRGNP